MQSFQRPLTLFLITIFLLFSFNAYACLVPVYGGIKVTQGSDCHKSAEQSAFKFCEGFKSLAVQSNFDTPYGFSHFVAGWPVPSFFPVPVTKSQLLPESPQEYLSLPVDLLILISVLRI